MKKIVCDLCDGTLFDKIDGRFVCRGCGTTYSQEEAREMMQEVEEDGNVNKENSLKNDNLCEKYLNSARKAVEISDWGEAERLYNLVKENNLENIEAVFYSAYAKCMATLPVEDVYGREAAFEVLNNAIRFVGKYYDPQKLEDNKKLIRQISNSIAVMFSSSFVFTEWKNGYGRVVRKNKAYTFNIFAKVKDTFCDTLREIAKKDEQPFLYEAMINVIYACYVMPAEWSYNFKIEMKNLVKKIQEDYDNIFIKSI